MAAPEYEPGVVEILAKRKNLRIIALPKMDRLAGFVTERFVDFKCLIDGGIIVQQSPINAIRSHKDLIPARTIHQGKEYAIERQPTQPELDDMSSVGPWSRESRQTQCFM